MLNESVTTIKGVGEKVQADLALMGIHTIGHLLLYFPYRYDYFEIKPLQELIHDDLVTIIGEVLYEPVVNFYGKKKSRLTFMLQVENVAVKAVMFNRAFAKKQMNPGDQITLTGKWDAHRLQITVNKYKLGSANDKGEIESIYSVKGNLTSYRLRKLIKQAINEYREWLEEFLPDDYLIAYKIPERKNAVNTMHFPENRQMLKHARRRFTYEELLLFQIKMQLLRKIKREASKGNQQNYDREKLQSFIGQLPYKLTHAQEKSLEEILADLKTPYRMNRLLQGDVGSGKTVVAALALYASITAGKQGALMVPTEILAEQHYHALDELFGDLIDIELLTGSTKGKKRKEIVASVASNQVDLLIGTHALIQDDVYFSSLGLVIVDEQHRFGVEQRRKLRDKGLYPDVLFMTATPIPRTLAITAFGDMDVSVIDEMPAGRRPVETLWAKENTFTRVLEFIKKHIENGEQAYVVCPLIEESDELDIQNAVELYEQLCTFYEPEIKVGLMHGRLHVNEKEEVMKSFLNNSTQVLVSTTVVEVGVNVPNATIMVIYDAQRFGLSQLHQLRGRVGRGDKQSYCILIADAKGEISKERMQIMTETTDGFELSERDLELRGPGDFFGKKQSGLPEFKVADMIHDYKALEIARRDATTIIHTNALETDARYKKLNQKIEEEIYINETLD